MLGLDPVALGKVLVGTSLAVTAFIVAIASLRAVQEGQVELREEVHKLRAEQQHLRAEQRHLERLIIEHEALDQERHEQLSATLLGLVESDGEEPPGDAGAGAAASATDGAIGGSAAIAAQA
eukprot:scaffold11.g4055.t1